MTPSLTLYFIVEAPEYQKLACYLAASIRQNFGPDVKTIGYCPAHKMDELDPNVIEVLRRLDTEVRPFETKGRFDPEYPHGNKILATLEPRDTDFSGFMDSDILCLRPNTVENVVKDGAVSLTPAASMYWTGPAIWNKIYGVCDMKIPEDRILLMRQNDKPRIPYFSSGFMTFPEQFRTPENKSFPEVWMDIAQTVDAEPSIKKKRPYLDQMTLPLAIQKAGLNWNLLPEEQHYILGGSLRGTEFPKDREIYTVHYRKWVVLKEAGLTGQAKSMLEKQAGVKKIHKL